MHPSFAVGRRPYFTPQRPLAPSCHPMASTPPASQKSAKLREEWEQRRAHAGARGEPPSRGRGSNPAEEEDRRGPRGRGGDGTPPSGSVRSQEEDARGEGGQGEGGRGGGEGRAPMGEGLRARLGDRERRGYDRHDQGQDRWVAECMVKNCRTMKYMHLIASGS